VLEVMKDPMVQKELLQTKSRPRTFESLQYATGKSMWSLFERYIRDFAECLADLEEVGVKVDRDALLLMEARATKDVEDHTREFANCMSSLRDSDGNAINPDAAFINVRSSAQLRLLLFGGAENRWNTEERLDATRQFPIPKGARAELPRAHRFELNSLELTPGPKRKHYSESGWPKTAASIVAQLAGDVPAGSAAALPKDGAAKAQLKSRGYTEEEAERASQGLLELSRATRTKAVLSGFIQPLLQHSEASGRIHPSWQFDTATGRLACRAPNLQNLPSAAHDRYGIRDAFRPSHGNLFIVADYSQLELRVLAHVANCPFMIDQIKKGGDYHSDVAVQIFPHVRRAVEAGEVKVNDDGRASGRTVKDVFKKERSHAKAVTFGIVYGMTASSLAEDLNVDADTAQGLFDAVLRNKPAVRKWMEHVRGDSRRNRRSLSILGRLRTLPLIGEDSPLALRCRSERAAVNFGIQGSAADIVVAAMLRLWRDPRLTKWGFRLVIQVHDEFVLEGPAERAGDAAEVVREIMENPFREHSPDFELKVPLAVAMTVRGSLGDGSCEEVPDFGIAPCAEAPRSPRQASFDAEPPRRASS
jgi:DNA polymerase-1